MFTYYGNNHAKPAQASSEGMEGRSSHRFSGPTHAVHAKMVYFGLDAFSLFAGNGMEGFSMKTIFQAALEVGMFFGVIFAWLQFLALITFGGVMVLTVAVLVKALS